MTLPLATAVPAFVLVPLAVTAAAAGLVVVAVRGRRVDDHPLCRRCGFDLFGKPADSARCAECGADLTGRRAVRVGRRQPRWRLAALAAVVLALSAGGGGVAGWARVKGVDPNRYKPSWWLSKETASR